MVGTRLDKVRAIDPSKQWIRRKETGTTGAKSGYSGLEQILVTVCWQNVSHGVKNRKLAAMRI